MVRGMAPPHALAALALLLSAGAAGARQVAVDDPTSRGAASGGQVLAIVGDRLSGFVLPIEAMPGEVVLKSTEGWTWRVDDTIRFYLRGDVSIATAGNVFRSQEAVVWMNRIPSERGLISQFAFYFDRVADPTQLAGIGPSGEDVLITTSALGAVRLRVPFLAEAPPPATPIVARGERRLAEHLRRLIAAPPPLRRIPALDEPVPPPPEIPIPGESPREALEQLPATIRLPRESDGVRLFDPRGLVAFSGKSVVVDENDDTVRLEGGIVVDYLDEEAAGGPRRLTLTAARSVVFLRAGTVRGVRVRGAGGPLGSESAQVTAEVVEGIYLEGDVVASDGSYNVRAARIYYDVPRGSAIMADAVLRTYARGGRIPVVARAEEMRQVSRDEWRAQNATVSTSEFFVPHVSLGARQVTVTELPTEGADGGRMVAAESLTLRAGRAPFFWWPSASGRAGDIPLRSIGGGYSSVNGAAVETEWDLLALAGIAPRDDLDVTLEIDGFTKRGPALGTKFRYDWFGAGKLDLYGMYDSGTDRTSAGLDVEPATEWRGIAVGEHRVRLDEHWTVDAQLAWFSDPTFLSSWREEAYSEHREYETSGYLLRQQDNHALDLLAKGRLNDFLNNEWQIGSRGYSVQRLPEGSYRRYGDNLFDVLSWSQEYRAGRLRIQGIDATPAELGIPSAAFGIASTENLRSALVATGVRENALFRADTRQELSAPFEAGPVKVVPYGVVRAAYYANEDFESYSSEAEDFRFFGATGIRASTEIQRVDDSVQNRLFGLHRLRHVIEPSVGAWYGYSNTADDAYPIYNEDLENISSGAAFDVNLRNTFQTQRGGPGRWRSVDFLVIDLGGVLNSGDTDRTTPTPQWYRWRPEYSRFGDHVYGAGTWQVTDTFALMGMGTWSFETDELARGSVGVEVAHSPDLTTFVEYRTIASEDSELLDVGWDYRLSRKYRVVVAPQIDIGEGDFRAANVAIVRSFPDFLLILNLGYDKITDETTFGARLQPIGF
ncbi:MAG TPA: hypothetical protein PKC43_01605 [Phycisphaerales bacterium]|nr:hypothetical protein [Phycisphaerales bacterium]HMP36121.1 hypothetical protein [Phycisphaerales bacterium]